MTACSNNTISSTQNASSDSGKYSQTDDNAEAKKGGSCIEPNGPTFDCYKENSYINRFYKEFWVNVDKNFKDNGESRVRIWKIFIE